MRKDRLIKDGIAAAMGVVLGVVGYTSGVRFGFASPVQGEDDSSGTKFPTAEQSSTPDSTHTAIPTFTPTPTRTLKPTFTATETLPALPQYYRNPWTGELPFNNLQGLYGEHVIEPMMQGLADRAESGGSSTRLDSTLTSLTNPFSPDLFGTDPLTEPGFGNTAVDLDNFMDVRYVIQNRSYLTLSGLLRLNENGIITAEVVGQEDDRDAAVVILAVEQAFISHKLEGFGLKGGNTLQDVFNDPEAVKVVEGIQEEMFKMIQEKFLDVSGKEEQDRKDDSGTGIVDASGGIPIGLQKPDQSVSCDVYRTPAESCADQLQSLREVTHNTDVGQDTFTEADSGSEQTLWVWSNNPATGDYKIGAFTSRAYIGPVAGQENSASGEQKLSCGEGGTKTGSYSEKPKEEDHEKGPNPDNGSDRGTGDTGNPGTGENEH